MSFTCSVCPETGSLLWDSQQVTPAQLTNKCNMLEGMLDMGFDGMRKTFNQMKNIVADENSTPADVAEAYNAIHKICRLVCVVYGQIFPEEEEEEESEKLVIVDEE